MAPIIFLVPTFIKVHAWLMKGIADNIFDPFSFVK